VLAEGRQGVTVRPWQAELRGFYNNDAPELDLESFAPAESDNFGLSVTTFIGPKGGGGEEMFDFFVCSPRWVAVPEWLTEDVATTCPPDDRTPERRVFPGATRQVLGMAMRRACKAAGLALYSPHDLRHRYASVKVKEGVPVTELSAQLGHARKSMTLDTYAHVLLDDALVLKTALERAGLSRRRT